MRAWKGAVLAAALLIAPGLAAAQGVSSQAPAAQALSAQPPAASAPARASVDRPPIDPAALAIVKAASDRLKAAKNLSFQALGAFDVPAGDGQPIFYYTRSNVLLARPDQLRVIADGDAPPSEFYFDGSTVAVLTPKEDLIAVASIPGDLETMLEKIYQKAGIYFTFVDFLVADPYAALTERLTGAFVIGQSTLIGGTTTNIVSLSDDKVQLQIWFGAQDHLPRLVWASAANDPAKPRHMTQFSDWKLDGELAKDAFAPRRSASVREIPFARPDESAAPDKR